MAKRKKKKKEEPVPARRLPDWAYSIKNWTIAMVGITATVAAGAMIRPGIEWAVTYDLRKRVDNNALNIYSKTAMIETRLTNIEELLKDRDEKRDKELLEMAFQAWETKLKDRLAKAE